MAIAPETRTASAGMKRRSAGAVATGLILALQLHAADQPQWGQAWSRNMVSTERNLPDSFNPATGSNVLWSAQLGTETYGTPVIAGGRVYIGTNNGHPRDPAETGDSGVLMCFDERTGRFLWQLSAPKRTEDIYFDWPHSGICSPVTVEGDRLYVVNNRGVVMCIGKTGATKPETNKAFPYRLAPAECEVEVVWQFDLTSGAGIWSHDAAHSSILIHGNHLYLNSGTGVDNTHRRIRTPDAPSLVVLDKRTGRLLARENEHIAPNIFHSTWSSPSLGDVSGRQLVFFAGGNGVVYAFEPAGVGVIERGTTHSLNQSLTRSLSNSPSPLRCVWRFDFDPAAPKTNVHEFTSNRRESPSDIFGMPVFHEGRVYVAGGGDIWWGKHEAWLKCIDAAAGTGDVTTNGLVWSYALQKHVMGTPAVWNGLVFIADCGGILHCVDAATGRVCWTHELKSEAWASPLVADGKVYLGTRRGTFCVLAAEREKKLLNTVEFDSAICSTAVAANGVLYVTTMNRLYAVSSKH